MTEPVSDELSAAQVKLFRKAIKWRTALAWVVVAILVVYYILHPVTNVLLVYSGKPAMMPLPELDWEDLLAILGGPIAGAYADRIKGD